MLLSQIFKKLSSSKNGSKKFLFFFQEIETKTASEEEECMSLGFINGLTTFLTI